MTNHTIKAKNKENGKIYEFNTVDNGGDCNAYKFIQKQNYYKDTEHILSQTEFNDLFEVVEDNMLNTCKEHGKPLHNNQHPYGGLEVVEDIDKPISSTGENGFKVGDRVKVNGYEEEWQISMIREDNRCTVWQIPKTGFTLIAHISQLELIPQTDEQHPYGGLEVVEDIPQTDTLKKEDWDDEDDYCCENGYFSKDHVCVKKEDWKKDTEYFLNELMEDYIFAKQIELKGNKSYYECRNIVIIDFITQEIAKAKEEVLEFINQEIARGKNDRDIEIIKMVNDSRSGDIGDTWDTFDRGFSRACDNIIDLIINNK